MLALRFVAALAVAGAACAAFGTGGSEGTTTTSPEAGVTAEAGVTTPSDAGTTPCDATFCDDFERTALLGPWGLVLDDMGEGSIGNHAYNGAHSAHFAIIATTLADKGGGHTSLQTMVAAGETIDIQFAFFPSTGNAIGNGQHANVIEIGLPTKTGKFNVGVTQGDADFDVVLTDMTTGLYKAGLDEGITFPASQWQLFHITIDTAKRTVTFELNGSASPLVPIDAFDFETTQPWQITLGPDYATQDAGAFQNDYDDVRVVVK